ncbi:hypothetical protein N9W89_11700 [Hellea sp.]|nr:hypothetical protein [Hellea sp.]
MMSLVILGVGLFSGAAIGLLTGRVMNSDMGRPARVITGVVGGALLAFFGPMMTGFNVEVTPGASLAGLDIGSIIRGIIYGGVGGAIMTLIFTKICVNK